MRNVVGEGTGDAREHVLEALARHQIAVGERELAEGGEQMVAAVIGLEIGGPRRWRQRCGKRCGAFGQRPHKAQVWLRRLWRDRLGRRRLERDQMSALVKIVAKSHQQPRDVGAGAVRGWLVRKTGGAGLRRQAIRRGTPPEDVSSITAGLLARGSLRLSVFPVRTAPVTWIVTAARRLQLRGQPRLGRCQRTGFPLSLISYKI
jgi:hypothetical protein